jgi:DNA-binding MarR family transcriptional regulator
MTISPKVPFTISRTVRQDCICLSVHRASRAIGRVFDEAFRPLGLNSFQFSLLMLLNRPNAPTISGLADDLAMDRTTITANLKPLERRGLITVRRDRKDARVRLVILTNVGSSLLAKCVPLWQRANESARARLRSRDLPSFYSGLNLLAEATSLFS